MRAVFLFLILGLSACTINKLYYVPTKIKHDVKKWTVVNRSKQDTNYVLIGENYQPTFVNARHEEKQLDYTIQSYVYTNNKNKKLNAWLIKPKNTEPKASIFFLHGNAGNIFWQYQGMIPLVKKGFQVFIIDYSGFGFSQGKATRMNVLNDARVSFNYFQNLPEIKNTKQIIYGQSLGGHLSAVLANEVQDKIDGLVIEGAFSSHKDIAAETAGFIGRVVVKEKYIATESIKSYKKPVLVIHSTEDKTIPFYMGKKIYDAANQPKLFYEIQKCHICGPIYYTDSISYKINQLIGL